MVKKELELIEVNYDGSKAVMVFLDEEEAVVREVTFNKQSWNSDTKKFIDDDKKAEQCEKWSQEYFGCSFDEIGGQEGVKKEIYIYDNYCSLWESNEIGKFDDDMVGEILEVIVSEAFVDDIAIRIRFEYEGNTYESKMMFATWIEKMKKYFPEPIKKEKQFKRFEEKFGIYIDNIDQLVGRTIIVEIKKAMGKFVYVEIKKSTNKRKKIR